MTQARFDGIVVIRNAFTPKLICLTVF